MTAALQEAPTVPDRMLTRAEAAELLRVSLRTLDRLAMSGELPKRRVGSTRRIVFRESDVRALLEQREGEGDE